MRMAFIWFIEMTVTALEHVNIWTAYLLYIVRLLNNRHYENKK